jgi:hypothetical protein
VTGAVDSLIGLKSFADMFRANRSSDLVGEGVVPVGMKVHNTTRIYVRRKNELGDFGTGEGLSRSLDGLRTGTGRSSSC